MSEEQVPGRISMSAAVARQLDQYNSPFPDDPGLVYYRRDDLVVEETRVPAELDHDQDLGGPDQDCEPIHLAECPACHAPLRLASGQWWEVVCECGLRWHLEIEAVGVPE